MILATTNSINQSNVTVHHWFNGKGVTDHLTIACCGSAKILGLRERSDQCRTAKVAHRGKV
jgi:hypothetical protein